MAETKVKVYRPGHAGTPMTPQELADHCNAVWRMATGNPSYTDSKGTHPGPVKPEWFLPTSQNYRLGGYHCNCGCAEDEPGSPSLGEFELFPLSAPSVRDGQKPYMRCCKCGCVSHL